MNAITSKGRITKKQQDEIDILEIRNNQPRITKMAFYVCLACILIILLIGVFLLLTDSISTGLTDSGEFAAGGEPINLTGPGAIIIGLMLMPLLFFWKSPKPKQ